MANTPPKGRGSAPPPRPKAPPGGKGTAKDVKATVTMLAAPKGTSRMLSVLLRGYGTAGISRSEDGMTSGLAIERRRCRELLFKLRKLWTPDQVSVTFVQNGNDISLNVEAESPPAPVSGDAGQTKTQAVLAKARAAAAEREKPPSVPGAAAAAKAPVAAASQEWGWKNSALDNPPTGTAASGMAGLDYSKVEGKNGAWPFGNGYRPTDADKLDAQAKRRLSLRDGKQKISLGANSDRQYLLEPDRATGGWLASRLMSEGPREKIGEGETYRDAVNTVIAYEEARAAIPVAPEEAPAPAPSAPAAPAPAPRVAAAPPAAPAPAPAAPAAPADPSPTQFTMSMLVPGPPSAPTRWAIVRDRTVLASGDELEDVITTAYTKVEGLLVIGWMGKMPSRARVAPETMIELDLQEGLQLDAAASQRLRRALQEQGDGGEDEEGEEDFSEDEGEGDLAGGETSEGEADDGDASGTAGADRVEGAA